MAKLYITGAVGTDKTKYEFVREAFPFGASAKPRNAKSDRRSPGAPASKRSIDIMAKGDGFIVLLDDKPVIPGPGERIAFMGEDDMVTLASGEGPIFLVHFIFPADLEANRR